MPVRLLTQSLLRWPEPQQVLTQVVDWAAKVAPDTAAAMPVWAVTLICC